MEKRIFIVLIFNLQALIFCANFDECPVKNDWTDAMIRAALKDFESETNQYLRYHQERDEQIADPQGFELWQIEARKSLEFKGRQLLRELKKEMHVE